MDHSRFVRHQRWVRALGKRASRKMPLWKSLRIWARTQLVRVLGAMVVAWIVGATLLYFVERGGNEAFDSWWESLWNVWVLLFSGPEVSPRTRAGKFITMGLLGVGVGLAGLFTGSVASILVAQNLRGRGVPNFEMEDHLVLCNWGPRGLSWVREVHSKIVQDKRPVVVIHDNPDEIDLPDKQDESAFNDVYIVKGDPANEIILRRARVSKAFSVVVLSDERQGEHADGKTILTCIALRNICGRGDKSPNIAVELKNPNNRHHLLKAGADEIISSDDLGLRLLARTALYHGMTRVYQELLTVNRDANEMYLYEAPPEIVGRDFIEVSSMFLRHRDDKRSCLLIGIQRNDQMYLNPIGSESGPIHEGDHLILLSRVITSPDQPLPTDPPLTSTGRNDTSPAKS
jgi:voltage-gated potassium channel